jgi:Ni,Fe-hydrogenase I small subunit
MECTICKASMAQCTCPDADQRLHDFAYGPRYRFLMFKWCRTCDKHYARCTCEVPDFFIISGGKELPIPEGGFHTVAGGRAIPDLGKR